MERTTTAAAAMQPGVMDFSFHVWAYPFGPLRVWVEVVDSSDLPPRNAIFNICQEHGEQ